MNLSPLPIQKFFDNNGNPLNGGLLFTYVVGTSTKLATYTDATGVTPNSNPVVLDYRGEANVWLDQTLTYKFVLSPAGDTDPPTKPIWMVDNISSAVTYASLTRQIIGAIFYPTSALEASLGATVFNNFYPYGYVDRYGTNTTPGTTDMLTAFNKAILVANGGIGIATALGGTYFHSAAITMQRYVKLQGVGKESTILLSTHAGDGLVMTNTINTSSPAVIQVYDLYMKNTNAANTGGGFVDVCGTYGEIRNVKFEGFKYGAILDQSEFYEIDLCHFLQNLQGCIWLVNGNDHTPGASPGFTNRITVSRCQFNNTPIAVIDDGGTAHSFSNNNFNLCVNHFRIAACPTISIEGGEHETATGDIILFRTTTFNGGDVVGPVGVAKISGAFFSPSIGTNIMDVSSLISLEFSMNRCITSAATVIGTSNINTLFAYGNYDSNVGTIFDGQAQHHFEFGAVKGFGQITDDLRLNGAFSPARFGVTYSASMTIDASLGNAAEITATNGTAFTINAPTNPQSAPASGGQQLGVTIKNSAGGALGVATWNAIFKMAVWVQPANGFSRAISFLYDGTNWVEKSRTPADVPN